MKKKLRFLVLAIMATSWMAVSAQEYHIQEGFDGSTPAGWTTSNTYDASSDNNGFLAGEKAVKMKATYSTVTLPSVVGADVLSYYIKPNNTFTDGKLIVETTIDNGTTWIPVDTIISDSSILVYEEQIITINDANAIIIRFVAEGGTGTSTLFMLDDVQLTKVVAAKDDAQLASLTMDGVPVPGFSASILNYEITIDYTTLIPQFVGEANNSAASVTTVQLTDLQGDSVARTATLEVLAEDGVTTQTYAVEVTVSDSYIETGFGNATVDSMGSVWTGWSDENTYITSSVKGPGNNGVYDGTSALKFMNKNEGDAPYLKSPALEQIETLSFWLFVEDPRAGAACDIKIESITDGVATEIATIAESELATDAWTEFTYDLNIVKATNILFTPSITGDWDGDMSTATRVWMDDLKITADPNLVETSISSSELNSQLQAYPNPVSDQLNINVENSTVKQVSLYNVMGMLMYSSQSEISTINMVGVPKGVYLLKVETDQGVVSRKILKN